MVDGRSCKHMHEYFVKTGIPSYVERVEGFELEFDRIYRSSGAQKLIQEQFGDDILQLSENLLHGPKPAPKYYLYKVTDFEHTCSAAELIRFYELIEYIDQLFVRVSFYIPIMFFSVLLCWEIFIIYKKDRYIYVYQMVLFYASMFFIRRLLLEYNFVQMRELKTLKWTCIDSNWYYQL